MLIARAPAKINLSLHVLGRRADGWHRLESLVVFAGVADRLRLAPGERLSLAVEGATAAATGALDDNLVLKAARALAARRPGLRVGDFTLSKRLPVAAGLGGGSSDAAAALRLLAKLNGIEIGDPDVVAAAAATGADVPVCVAGRGRIMRGTGDELGPALDMAALPAVLVNPMVAVPTVEVFRRLGLPPGATLAGADHPPEGAIPHPAPALVETLRGLRNDLEPPAVALAPVIATAIGALAAAPGVRLARMSGSGATVFGIVDDRQSAVRVARYVGAAFPGWWIVPTLLRA